MSSKDQEILDENPNKQGQDVQWGATTYKPDYVQKAFDILSRSTTAKTKSHLCVAFQCSKPTLLNWMKVNPEFRSAVEAGLEHGAAKFRNKIAKYAFKPSAKVNNGLIKLLANNVYGIKEEIDPSVIVNNNVDTNPEQEMKNRGIPVPNVDLEDIDE